MFYKKTAREQLPGLPTNLRRDAVVGQELIGGKFFFLKCVVLICVVLVGVGGRTRWARVRVRLQKPYKCIYCIYIVWFR